jgi:uncharacterized DUF497 family protein
MKTAAFQWDEDNIEHLAVHRVEPFEAEEVLDDDPLILKTRDDKYLAYGQTDAGRYLLVVFTWKSEHTIRVVTTRDLTPAEKSRFKRRKQ